MTSQCPSTRGTKAPPTARELARVNGRGPKAWRSVEEFSDDPGFREFVEREFPSGASVLLDEQSTRRGFLKLMGASLALAGAATIPGCRRPDHRILPYSQTAPEDIIPGKPLYYATAMPLPGGGAEGLLVETHEGRPTKVEGNPLHPVSQGRTSVFAQASVLGLYDPDRIMVPVRRAGDAEYQPGWDAFVQWTQTNEGFGRFDSVRGRGLAIVVDKKSSPSRDALRDRIRQRWPEARWIAYEPIENVSAVEGSRIAFGQPMRERLTLSKAKRIVAIERDFTYDESDALVNAREFALTRDPGEPGHSAMGRLYVAESSPTPTGGVADHRQRIAPSAAPALAARLAQRVMERLGADSPTLRALAAFPPAPGAAFDEAWVEAAAEDLASHRGEAVLLVGRTLPAAIHAAAAAVNEALGATGPIVTWWPMSDEEASDGSAALAELAGAIDRREVELLVTIGADPVYTAPADLDFAARYRRVPTTICLSVESNDTAAASTMVWPGAHYLESWGDVRALDGTLSIVQPMIAPLYAGHSELEMLAVILGDDFAEERAITQAALAAEQAGLLVTGEPAPGGEAPAQTEAAGAGGAAGYDIVRATWRATLGQSAGQFEKTWRRTLHDGLLLGSTGRGQPAQVRAGAVAEALRSAPASTRAPDGESLDVIFATSRLYDGRYANCGWLQELPEIGSMTAWDNPAFISPATAEQLGLIPNFTDNPKDIYLNKFPKAHVATLEFGGRSLDIPVWILPGMADGAVLLRLGYGREHCGLVGSGVGVNTYRLRASGAMWQAGGATLRKTGRREMVASTQNHWSLEGRDTLIRQVDLPAWEHHGATVVDAHDFYGYGDGSDHQTLNFAERLGELSHTPPNRSIYINPLNQSRSDAAPGSPFATGQQWGKAIDLAKCIGCGVCTVACQSENNIAIVGKEETARGREMAWIRVDRYFVGDDLDNPEEVMFQPVACQQCENAPCETVCPVNATVHGPEGINYMVYNRCIGTRYCANNCPYKVRRFNFFDYGTTKFNGGLHRTVRKATGGAFDGMLPDNQHKIPPRLLSKLDEISKMQKNPDVTVRSRGVMEKCTYCIQRINNARYEASLRDLKHVPDGFFQVACQQACPTGAIVFGDINDKESAVSKMHASGRAFALLGFLNTRPRTEYLIRVKNPNPALRQPVEDPFHHGGDHGGGDTHGEQGHAMFDPKRAGEDAGYALSLKVIGA
ncbi:MAG: TAT-variant-translocated molybdopterin oxidoreductase [Phycisphaerales bacterium JB039]